LYRQNNHISFFFPLSFVGMEAYLRHRQATATAARGSRPTINPRPQEQPPPPTTLAKQTTKQAHTGEGLIQSNSIQRQFASLSNDRDRFRQEKEQCEGALLQVQNEYQALKKEQDELTKKNFHAKAELGEYSKKLDMLKEELKRTTRNLDNDTKAVESCTNHLKSLESKKMERENKFVANLNPVTLEIAIFLQKRLEKTIEERITVQSVESVVLPFLKAKQDQGNPELQNGLFGLNESIDRLKQATASRDEAVKQLREILIQLHDLGADLDDLMEDCQLPQTSAKARQDDTENVMDSCTENNMTSMFYGTQEAFYNDSEEEDLV
jgi:predicted  nucleic acid-binding Zn-ribbon protein